MKSKVVQSLVAVFSLLLLLTVFGLLVAPLTPAQVAEKVKSSVISVLVVNSASEPVPVAGTVNLANDDSNPLTVKNPVIQPVHFTTQFEVPAGKRLVVEYISAEFRSEVPCNVLDVDLRVSPVGGGAPPVRHTYFPRFIGQDSSGGYNYGLSENIRAYIDEGESAVLGGTVCGSSPPPRVTGHLVDK